jgi:PAS domain S-box-containing protein
MTRQKRTKNSSPTEVQSDAIAPLTGPIDRSSMQTSIDLFPRLATVLWDSHDAVYVHDFDGKITAWNRGAVRMLGYSEAEALQMNETQLIPEELRADVRTRWQRVRHGEQVESWVSQSQTKDGRLIDVWITATALKDDQGLPVAIAKTERDVSLQRRVQTDLEQVVQLRTELLRKSQEQLAAVLQTAADAVITIDTRGVVQTVNAATERMFGYAAAELIGQNVRMLMPSPYREEHDRYLTEYARTGVKKIIGIGREAVAQRKDGSTFPMDLSVSEVDHLGLFTGILRDITTRKQAEVELRRKESELSEAQRIAHIGSWTWDATTDLNTGSDELFRILGLDSTQPLPPFSEQRGTVFTPESWDRMNAAMQETMRTGVGYSVDLEVLKSDGPMWITGRGEPVRDKDGQIVGLRGTVLDITQQKLASEALRESERFARSTLDGLAAHIAIVDEAGTIITVNRAWREFAVQNGARIEQVCEGTNYLSASENATRPYADQRPATTVGIRAVLARQLDEFVLEYPCHSLNQERWFLMRVTPFPGDGPRRAVIAHENITDRKRLEREVVGIASLEQRRIGQDLHDSVGQELTALNLLASDLTAAVGTVSGHGAKLVTRIVQGLRRSQKELRSVMQGLLPVAVDSAGLMASLADLAERTEQEANVICVFSCPAPVSIADNLAATHLYLIAREAVHNAVKHAVPKNIRIVLEASDQVVLSVKDDGRGLPSRPAAAQGGLGLRIMHNRAAIIGARLTIEPAHPTGTCVTCTWTRSHHATTEGQ